MMTKVTLHDNFGWIRTRTSYRYQYTYKAKNDIIYCCIFIFHSTWENYGIPEKTKIWVLLYVFVNRDSNFRQIGRKSSVLTGESGRGDWFGSQCPKNNTRSEYKLPNSKSNLLKSIHNIKLFYSTSWYFYLMYGWWEQIIQAWLTGVFCYIVSSIYFIF